jgi:hypothetical protein
VQTAVSGLNFKLFLHFLNFEILRTAINFDFNGYINRITSRNPQYKSSSLEAQYGMLINCELNGTNVSAEGIRGMKKSFADRAGKVLNQMYNTDPPLFLEIMIKYIVHSFNCPCVIFNCCSLWHDATENTRTLQATSITASSWLLIGAMRMDTPVGMMANP